MILLSYVCYYKEDPKVPPNCCLKPSFPPVWYVLSPLSQQGVFQRDLPEGGHLYEIFGSGCDERICALMQHACKS